MEYLVLGEHSSGGPGGRAGTNETVNGELEISGDTALRYCYFKFVSGKFACDYYAECSMPHSMTYAA